MSALHQQYIFFLQLLAHKTLVQLLGMDPEKDVNAPLPTTYPYVSFAYVKHIWKQNKKVSKQMKISMFHNKTAQCHYTGCF